MALQASAGYAALSRVFQWAAKPLRYSVLRVNTLRITPEDALEKARLSFAQKASQRGCVPPTVHQHPLLPEALIVSPWPDLKIISAPLPERQNYPVVIVDLICGNAVLRGAPVFNGGVLAISETASVGETVSVYAFREGLRSFVGYGILHSLPRSSENNEGSSADKVDYDCIVEMTEGLSNLPAIPQELNAAGLVIGQSLPSIMASCVLNPQPGERILDLGCGSGIMTTHLAALSSNKADIVAVDISKQRINTLIHRCALTGAKVTPVCANAKDFVANETSKFDRILMNPNHSCYGSHPYLVDFVNRGRGVNTSIRAYIEPVFDLLKPGGHLVYCTGSVLPIENDDVVRWVLDQRSDIELVPAEPRLAPVGVQSPIPIPSWMRLSSEEDKLIQRFGLHSVDLDPDPVNADATSFFIAHFRKTC